MTGESSVSSETSLDEAWADAEAAIVAAGLNDRFVSVELAVFRALGDAGEPIRYVASAERIEHRQPTDPPAVTHQEETEADTPAAALQALAARLRETPR